jgi:serine protease Do
MITNLYAKDIQGIIKVVDNSNIPINNKTENFINIETNNIEVKNEKNLNIQNPKIESKEKLEANKCPCDKIYINSLADIVSPLIPTVVNIYSNQNLKNEKNDNDKLPIDYFNEFLEQFDITFEKEKLHLNSELFSIGSGFIISADGYIVTNYHVIERTNDIQIKFTDNRELPARIISFDKKTDIALLKVDSEIELPYVKFANSTNSRVGDRVIAIGNPFGTLNSTVTSGIISAKSRDINIENGIIDNFIQTDTAIHPGNSGSPLFNMFGEVIGINTAIFSPSEKNIGIGFAIPSNMVKIIIERLKQNEQSQKIKLGVSVKEITKNIKETLLLDNIDGVFVSEVSKDSLSDKVGIKSGDIIIEFCNEKINNPIQLQKIISQHSFNKIIEFKILRKGEFLELKINPISDSLKKNDEINYINESKDENIIIKNNISFMNLTEDYKKTYHIQNDITGIMIYDIPENILNYDLKIGDLIFARWCR